MATTRIWKIYGQDGHRQRMSFGESLDYNFTKGGKTRKIEVEAADKTGTNDYVVVKITRDTAEECLDELNGQLDDGIFEDSKYGKIEEVTPETVEGDKVERIREFVRRCGTQRKMADRFSIPLRTIENWSVGKRMCPGYVPLMISTILDDEVKINKLAGELEMLRRELAVLKAKATAKETEPDERPMVYVLRSQDYTDGDIWDVGYYWTLGEAICWGRLESKGDKSAYWIEGYHVDDDNTTAKGAYMGLERKRLSEQGYLGDSDFFEQIKTLDKPKR